MDLEQSVKEAFLKISEISIAISRSDYTRHDLERIQALYKAYKTEFADALRQRPKLLCPERIESRLIFLEGRVEEEEKKRRVKRLCQQNTAFEVFELETRDWYDDEEWFPELVETLGKHFSETDDEANRAMSECVDDILNERYTHYIPSDVVVQHTIMMDAVTKMMEKRSEILNMFK